MKTMVLRQTVQLYKEKHIVKDIIKFAKWLRTVTNLGS
jgi:hypothetical protein